MLEYENQMLLEAIQDDGLVISAKGLGLETVFINIIKAYSDPGNLVIVIGTIDAEETYIIDKLKEMGVKNLPRIITAQVLSNERQIMYLEGGVLFISGRILVVDLLKDRVPLKLVTGMLVYRAHSIMNNYQEAFALRLYRKHNKSGFIKAFSNSSLSFTIGFSQVERIMKTLFVKNLYLWPRFHSVVQSSLSKYKPNVIELHVKLTPKMLKIQSSILDIMAFIVKEIKNRNKYLEFDELNVENAIAKKYHKQLQRQLDSIWNQLGSSTKQLVADLKMLESFLGHLIYDSSVIFYGILSNLKTLENAEKMEWFILDVANDLFTHAKSRVYNNKNEFKPENCPKWEALTEVLNEIQIDMNAKDNDTNENSKKVLILVNNWKICGQLKNYLIMGANEYLLYEAMKHLKKDDLTNNKKDKNTDNTAKAKDTAGGDDDDFGQDSYVLTYSQKTQDETNDNNETINYFQDCSQAVADEGLSKLCETEPIVMIQTVKKFDDPMALQKTLYEIKPSYVIMYGTDISSVRQLEVYQNNNTSISLKVYFIIYGGSVEEQGYLTSLRREKESFEKLINTKKNMVVPRDQDGKLGDTLNTPEKEELNSRKGDDLNKAKIIPKVIVDIREFRSELPALLHKRGIEIEPITLVVGDYIITPEICIERKSISDLIMSLSSGRLYNQAVSMTRHYAKPMLLIEFDQNKAFSLSGNYYISKDMKSSDITSKLQLLTLHFPKLKIVWSPSPQATAQLFDELKEGKEQPVAEIAAQIGLEEEDDKQFNVDNYNTKLHDFVLKLPGVHTKNIRRILNDGGSLDNLVKLTQAELANLMGNSKDAELLYKAFHEKTKKKDDSIASTSGMSKAGTKIKKRGLFNSKKK
ncbi:DNA repair endonuclease XPF [Aphidius gifuensis]|nr:DNA repair endonuclease XPF [Aphidius gifuensis]